MQRLSFLCDTLRLCVKFTTKTQGHEVLHPAFAPLREIFCTLPA
jgi:hypothetical protein